MKRRQGLLIGSITAAITFGLLMLTLGPANFGKYNRHHAGKHCMEQRTGDATKQ